MLSKTNHLLLVLVLLPVLFMVPRTALCASSLSGYAALSVAGQESLGKALTANNQGRIVPLIGHSVSNAELESFSLPYEQTMQQYLRAMQAADFDSMISLLRQLKSICREDLRAPLYLAQIMQSIKHYREAAAEYHELHERFSDSSAAGNYTPLDCRICKGLMSFREAACYMSQGEFSVAESKFNEAVEAEPENISAWIGLAGAQEASGSKAAAHDTYQKIISKFPSSNGAKMAKAQLDVMEASSKEEVSAVDKHCGLWDFTKPISVYIDSGQFCSDYKPYLRQYCQDALEEWSLASGRGFKFVFLPYSSLEQESTKRFEACGHSFLLFRDPIPADIHILWANTVKDSHTLGATFPIFPIKNAKIQHKLVAVACGLGTGGFIPASKDYSLNELKEAQKRSLRYTLLHELGHALGLSHLYDSNSVMFYAAYGGHSSDITRDAKLTAADVKALQLHYGNFHPSAVQNLQTLTMAQILRFQPIAGSPSVAPALKSATRQAADSPTQQVLQEISMGKFDSALEKLNSLLLSNDRDGQLHYLRGVCFTKLKQYDKAKADYQEAIKLAPGSPTSALAEKGLAKLK